MVRGRSPGSPGRTRIAGMILAAVLLLVMVSEARGKSQLSIVEDIDKSLENIFRDVQTLQHYIVTTTEDVSTPGGATTSEVSSETSSEFSVSTTVTTDVDTSSTDISTDNSNASPGTSTTTIPTSTTPTTTTADFNSSMSTTAESTIFSTMTTIPNTSIPTTTSTSSTTSTTSTTSTNDSTTSTNIAQTTSATTTTTSATTASATTTSATTTSATTTSATTTSATTTSATTTSATTSPDPGGPKLNDRVKRRNLLPLGTLDDALGSWVVPRIAWLEDKTTTETSDLTSDLTSSEYTIFTSPGTDILRLEAALSEVDQVVTQVAAGTITEDQVGQMQAAEAEVKDVTDQPDDALQEELQSNPDFLPNIIEQIKKDQDTIAQAMDELKRKRTSVIVGSVLGGILLIVLVAVGAVCYDRHTKKKNNGGRATAKKRSQSASASAQQQMVELGSNRDMEESVAVDELPPHSTMPPNPRIPRANLENFSLSSAQRNVAQESNRIPDHEPPMQVSEMRSEPGIENPGYVEEYPPRPVVPPKPRKRPSTFDNYGLPPSQMRIEQEPSGAYFIPSKQNHYIDELSYRLSPREQQVRPVGENYHSPTEPSRRSSRDPPLRHHQRHQHPRNHRIRPRNDHHVRRTPSVPPPDYTIPRDRHQSSDYFMARRPHSQKQQRPRSPYGFEAPQRTAAPPKSEAPLPERNRSDIRRPYGPEDLY